MELLFLKTLSKTNRENAILEGLELLERTLSIFLKKHSLYSMLSKEDIEDIKSEATINMIQAVDRFDKKKNVKLSTFLYSRLMGSFKDSLNTMVGKGNINIQSSIDSKISTQIENIFNLSPNQAIAMCKNIKIHDIAMCENDMAFITQNLFYSISKLPDIKAYVLLSFYTLDKSVREISEDIGLSETSGMVYRIKRNAIQTLKQELKNKGF